MKAKALIRKSLLMIFFCAALYNVNGQEDQFGAKTGVNLCRFVGSSIEANGFKPGFNVGIFYKANLNRKLFFRTEFYYSSQGHKDNPENNSKTTTSINYLNFPLFIEYGNRLSFLVGPNISLMLSGKKEGSQSGMSGNISNSLHTGDIGIAIGANLKVHQQVSLGVRFNRGLTNVFPTSSDPETSGAKNFMFQFAIDVVLKSYTRISK